MLRRLGGCWRGFNVWWVVKGEVEPGERRGGMEEVCNLKCVDGRGFGGSFSRSRVYGNFSTWGLGMGMEEVDGGVRLN